MMYYNYYTSPIGLMLLVADDIGLRKVEFVEKILDAEELNKIEKTTALEFSNSKVIKFCMDELTHYFNKKLTHFTSPLSLKGTNFQIGVWNELVKVPFGLTQSYLQQARKLQNEKGIRAVAKANGSNPIAIIVPCHRIIGSNGQLTGYAGGLWRKKWLLEHEGALKNEQLNLF